MRVYSLEMGSRTLPTLQYGRWTRKSKIRKGSNFKKNPGLNPCLERTAQYIV